MSSSRNLLSLPASPKAGEIVEELLAAGPVRIERIVSRGDVSPPGFWYDQDEDEWVAVLSGEARLAFIDRPTIHLQAGDYLLIPAHQQHRVEWTSTEMATIWLAVFFSVEPNDR